jgi:leader peptidase (prepilin peptidase)/N-methyltransferase
MMGTSQLEVSLSVGTLLLASVCAFVLGAVIGSFLNVVIYRVPRGASIVRPPSACPVCGHSIRWYHNLPVAGWLALRGRCRDCGERISVRYLLVEAATGALFALAVVVFGLSAELPLVLGFISVLIAVAFIDLDFHVIPDRIVLPASLAALIYSIALDPSRWWQYVVWGLGAALFLFVIALVWSGGMGMGDVKLALLLGFVLGPQVVVGLFVSFFLGGLTGVVLLATGRKGRKDRLPFGPFLAVGALLALFVGTHVTDWYLGLL